MVPEGLHAKLVHRRQLAHLKVVLLLQTRPRSAPATRIVRPLSERASPNRCHNARRGAAGGGAARRTTNIRTSRTSGSATRWRCHTLRSAGRYSSSRSLASAAASARSCSAKTSLRPLWTRSPLCCRSIWYALLYAQRHGGEGRRRATISGPLVASRWPHNRHALVELGKAHAAVLLAVDAQNGVVELVPQRLHRHRELRWRPPDTGDARREESAAAAATSGVARAARLSYRWALVRRNGPPARHGASARLRRHGDVGAAHGRRAPRWRKEFDALSGGGRARPVR